MAKSILKAGQIAADNVDSYNKFAKCASAVENGMVGVLGLTPADGEVFTFVANTAIADANMYMVNEPVRVLINGVYAMTDDPTLFDIAIGTTFTVYRPQVGDEIILSTDAFSNAVSTNTFAIAKAGQLKMEWAATASTSSLVYSLIEATTINVPSSTFYGAKVVAYKLRCVKA